MGRGGFLEEATLHSQGQAGEEGMEGEHGQTQNPSAAEWKMNEVQERVLRVCSDGQ